MFEKTIRVLTWTVFGLGFVLVVLVALLASLTGASRGVLAQQTELAKSKVKVQVPHADTLLYIEGRLTKTTGLLREFDTPAMAVGKRYEYEFRAVWKPSEGTTITRVRSVKFSAGDEVEVDLTKSLPTDQADVVVKPPTEDMVKELLKVAALEKNDVVLQPDCQDAGILIAVAGQGVKQAIAVQDDPKQAETLTKQVREAKLEGLVLVKVVTAARCTEYDEATVVVLNQVEEMNLALRPVLFDRLPVGARVLALQHGLGDFAPTQSTKGVNANGEDYTIHQWVITKEAKERYGSK
jgi:uncharacterized protein (TIGR03000 family)